MRLAQAKHSVGNIVREMQARPHWKRLGQVQEDPVAAIARAALATRATQIEPEEEKAIDKIEEVRARLLASDTPVTYTDFGALHPWTELTEEELYKGEERTRPLAEIAKASKPPKWALLLFKLARELKPDTVLEMGTCVGISAAYLLAALQLNGKGRLITMEGGKNVAEIAEENLQNLGFTNFEIVTGRHQDTLPSVLADNKPIDFAFVDGDHAEHTTITYHEQVLEHTGQHAVIYHDDIRWSPGMRRCWQHICDTDRSVTAILDFHWVGVMVIDKNYRGSPKRFNLFY